MLKKSTVLLFCLILVLSSIALSKEYTGPAPTTFSQSPILDQEVENGDLPSVEERLPEEPYVVDPNDSIGIYGGTYNLATRYANLPLGVAFIQGMANLIVANPEASGYVPRLAKEVIVNDDYTKFTFVLRKGTRWSDGVPFTTDDIMFWYNDILLNKELTPSISPHFKRNGEVMEVKKIDDYTFEFNFEAPNPYFLTAPAIRLDQSNKVLAPKHYLKQFHPNYVDKDKLLEEASEAGFASWYEYFEDKFDKYNEASLNPDLPVLGAYMPVKITSSRRVYKRNPYFWKVDKAGNQLPYVDKVEVEVVSDPEVIDGKIISGEIDFNGFATKLSNYPMYRQYEDRSDYNTIIWDSGLGNEVVYMFNMTSKDEVLRDIFRDKRFRIAMSMAINRDEINEALYFNKAKPRSYTVLPTSKYYVEEFEDAHTEYNPEKAKSLLDEMGLTDEDGDGWRERPDGKKLTFTLEYTSAENPLRVENVNLVASYWKDLGIDMNVKLISSQLLGTRRTGNQIDVTLNDGWNATDIFFPVRNFWGRPGAGTMTMYPKFYDKWFRDAEIDQEIPEEIQNLYDWSEEVVVETDPAKRKELCEKILQSQAENCWVIGTVGKVPHPVIVDKDLRNLPESVIWAGDVNWTMSRDPEQFYFTEDADER